MPSLRLTALLFGLAVPHALSAQQADTTRRVPPSPAAFQQLPAFPGTVSPSEETQAHFVPPVPLAADGSVSIMLLTPRSLANYSRRRPLARYMNDCFMAQRSGQTGGLAPAVVPEPWAPYDSAAAGFAFLLLQIGSPLRPQSPCDASRDPAIRAAGVQFLAGAAELHPTDDVRSATVSLRGQLLHPVVAAQTATVLIGPNGAIQAPTPGSVRLYFAPDAFRPDARGRFASAVVSVTTADARRHDSVVLPDSVLADAWREFTTWRLKSLSGTPPMADLPRFATPVDTGYQRAAALYAGGRQLDAALAVARRRDEYRAPTDTTPDGWFADLLIGSVFLAHGDSAAGRVEYANALDHAPCLQLSAHEEFNRVLDQLRPSGVRCSSVPLHRQLLWGLVVPGGGQWVHGDRVGGGVVSVLTVGMIALALEQHAQAQSQFNDYRRAVPPADVAGMLDRANASQHAARSTAVAAVGVWLFSGAIGALTEAWHAHWTQPQQHFEPTSDGSGGAR
ncbi:MAG TPA: hypothetical protein VF737_05665 [Gemmatimonadaceae bacterium]